MVWILLDPQHCISTLETTDAKYKQSNVDSVA